MTGTVEALLPTTDNSTAGELTGTGEALLPTTDNSTPGELTGTVKLCCPTPHASDPSGSYTTDQAPPTFSDNVDEVAPILLYCIVNGFSAITSSYVCQSS